MENASSEDASVNLDSGEKIVEKHFVQITVLIKANVLITNVSARKDSYFLIAVSNIVLIIVPVMENAMMAIVNAFPDLLVMAVNS